MRQLPFRDVEDANRVMLSRLLRHAAEAVPFYRSTGALLEAAADGRSEAWAALPIVKSEEWARRGSEALATDFPDGEELLPERRSWTSVSTPIAGPLGVLNDIADKAQWEFLAYSRGIDTSGRFAAILPDAAIQPGDLAGPLEPWSIDAHSGSANLWSDRFDAATTLDWLANVRPVCVFCDTRSFEMLLVAALQPLAVKDVLVWGCSGMAGLAQARPPMLRGARVHEVIASREVGFVASADSSGRFVPASETIFVEIVDDAGHPSGPGQPGRLVASAIYSYVRPVLRLDLGLLAQWDGVDLTGSDRPRFRLLT